MIKISQILDPQLVIFLDVKTRDEVLEKSVDLLHQQGKLTNTHTFFEAIIQREKIVSTGIGMGVAIPHAKLADFQDFFIAIAILKQGVEWNALDHSPVRIVCMIGGPDDKQTEYLQILSKLTLALKDESKRKKMLTTNSSTDIIELFKNF